MTEMRVVSMPPSNAAVWLNPATHINKISPKRMTVESGTTIRFVNRNRLGNW